MPLANVTRYTLTAANRCGGRAVVLGASMGGFAAARVLADAFDEVILIERDPLPEERVTRAGALQTSHPHVLLEAGRATLEDFFPGFSEDVIRQGGLIVDAATERRTMSRVDSWVMDHIDSRCSVQGGRCLST